MRRLLIGAAAAALVAALACQSATNGPTLWIESSSVDAVHLRWTPPTQGDVTGYVLERRLVPEDFRPLAQLGLGTMSFTAALTDFLELSDLEFRVRAVSGQDGDRSSNVVAVRRGLRAPTLECAANAYAYACPPSLGLVELRLANHSAAADGLVLERGFQGSGGGLTWTSIPLSAGAATFVDDVGGGWVDGAYVEYRLAAVHGAERSLDVARSSGRAPPLPPRIVAVTGAGAGVAITFENASRSATGFHLDRLLPSGSLDDTWCSTCNADRAFGGTGTLVHPSPADASGAFYSVCADGYAGASAACSWVMWPAPASDLNVSAVIAPPGASAVRTGNGTFANGRWGSSGGEVSALSPRGHTGESGYEVDRLSTGTGWYGAGPKVAVDLAGRVHALYTQQGATGAALAHAVHDGTAWSTEEVAPLPTYGTWVSLDVAADGTVLAAWQTASGLRVAWRTNSAWTIEDVPLVPSSSHWIAGDALGGVHVLAYVDGGPGNESLVHASRAGSGWTVEPVSSSIVPAAFLGRGDGVVIVGTSSGSVAIAQRTSIGWGAPELLGVIAGSSALRAVHSPDGMRVALSEGGRLWVLDDTGTVESHWPYDGSSWALGFDLDGKAWVLERLDPYVSSFYGPPPSMVVAALFEEP